jgi:hypothetical protein
MLHRQPGESARGVLGVATQRVHQPIPLCRRQMLHPRRRSVGCRLPPALNGTGDMVRPRQQRGARVAGTDERRRRPARAAVALNGIDERGGMGRPPSGRCNLHPCRENTASFVRADQGCDGGGQRGRLAHGGGEEFRTSARQRAECADHGMHPWRERQDAGILLVAQCGCNDLQIGGAAQRVQRCGEGGRNSVQCMAPFIAWKTFHGRPIEDLYERRRITVIAERTRAAADRRWWRQSGIRTPDALADHGARAAMGAWHQNAMPPSPRPGLHIGICIDAHPQPYERSTCVTGGDERCRRTAFTSSGVRCIDELRRMRRFPPDRRHSHPWRRDGPSCVRSDRHVNGEGEGGRVPHGRRKKVCPSARQRTRRADDRMHVRRERRHAGELEIARGGRNDGRVGFAVQRSQRRRARGGWGMHGGCSLQRNV